MTSDPLTVPISLLEGATAPEYATDRSAGMDLRAYLDSDIVLAPGARGRVPTGVRVAIPTGYEGQVRGRSGLADRHGIGLVNGPGTIDADYRGEIQVILINWGSQDFTIRHGERIAQLVIAPVARVSLQQVADLDDTQRGEGGFGHTGQ